MAAGGRDERMERVIFARALVHEREKSCTHAHTDPSLHSPTCRTFPLAFALLRIGIYIYYMYEARWEVSAR